MGSRLLLHLFIWALMVGSIQASVSLYQGYYSWTRAVYANGTEIVPQLGQALRVLPARFPSPTVFAVNGEILDGDDFHFDAEFIPANNTNDMFVILDESVYWTDKKCLDDTCPGNIDSPEALVRAKGYRTNVQEIVESLNRLELSGDDMLTLSGPVGTLEGVRADDPAISRAFYMVRDEKVVWMLLVGLVVTVTGWF